MGAGDQRTILLAEVRDAFGRIVWSHKTHEKACDSLLTTERRIKTGQVLLTAVTSGSILSVLVADTGVVKILAAVFALLSTALSLYARNFTPGATAEKHRDCAARLWAVREQYISLIGDLTANAVSLDAARKSRDDLSNRAAKIYQTAPRTTADDYKRAGRALTKDGEMTLSSAEIDAFLPQAFRTSIVRSDTAPATAPVAESPDGNGPQ